MSRIIDQIIRREGGFVDHPDDRGGPTNYGITQKTLSQVLGYQATRDNVANLTEDQARRIYQTLYIVEPGFDAIRHPFLAELVIDCGVNHGPARAAKWLQKAAGVTVDGIVGPKTLSAVNRKTEGELYVKILATRARFYGRIITRDPSQAVFAEGWANRLAEFIESIMDEPV